MQTFLPYPDLLKTAKSLDNKRLGKQRVEGWQILKCLLKSNGWNHHPAVKMWRGHAGFLFCYVTTICHEWINRGFQDSVLFHLAEIKNKLTVLSYVPPPWFGNEDFHRAHQSNLVRKDHSYYSKLFPGVPNDLPYIWPEEDYVINDAEEVL